MGYSYTAQLNSPDWHWEIVYYFFVAGIAIGSYMFSAFGQLWGSRSDREYSVTGYFFAMPLIALSGLLLVLDLAVPDRFLRFYHMMFNPRDLAFIVKGESVMSMGSWAIGLFSLLSTVSFIYALIKTLKWEKRIPLSILIIGLHEGKASKAFLPIGILTASYIGTYTGILLSTTHWPAWSSSLIPILFLVSGVSTGLAAMVLAMARKMKEAKGYIHRLEKADTVVMILELIIIAGFLVSLGALAPTYMSGTNGFLLFGGVVFAGLILPLIIRYRVSMLGEKNSLILSSSLILIGGFILRYILVIGGQFH
ncbi:NrfD/PsrC family molybdoenzyme membrane anchor subunit [Ammoniphilus sp. YIM 78166]|uniref:NrfD/PsrC family molybdoenzyme membrane anchor subunit n=1 Tax=Ammoniphilus sp. YIM 78166 TaxID=1644106 RepID=UPI00106FEB15|nr:NrfD/PsrC family molybdoenzyme membrane anchor subunit [Ammoniphilus sp. YIM 78166]